jgi:hypothetical protein
MITKKIKLVRWGGLSSVDHSKFYKKRSYHSPPVKKGIFVFHPDFIEPFLYAWKLYDKNDKRNKIRKQTFNYSGKLWTHLYYNDPEITYYRVCEKWAKRWYETDTDSIEKIYKLEVQSIIDEYGNGLRCTMDHMELFIEK